MINRFIKVAIACLAVVFLLLFMPGLLATFYWNLGLVAWNRGAAWCSGQDLGAIRQAGYLWERALAWRPEEPDLLLYLGAAYDWMGEEQKALGTWQRLHDADYGFDFLMTKGQQCLTGGFLEASLHWFRGASQVAPGIGDPWYYIAQVLSQTGQPEEALVALDKGLETARLEEVRRSQMYFQKGILYQWKIQPRRLEDAAEAYRTALASGDFPYPGLEAETHYRLGEMLWWEGKDPDLYIAEYEHTIALNPLHESAHILLGVAYYAKYRDVERAEAEILLAMEINPKNFWGPMHLGGRVYEPAGMIEEAIEAYQWALRINPDFEPAKQALQRFEQRQSPP